MVKHALFQKFHIQVYWDQNTHIEFRDVSGLYVKPESIKHLKGAGSKESEKKMAGFPRLKNITLKKGIMAGNSDFFKWAQTTRLETPEHRDIMIRLLNEDFVPILSWRVRNAFPVKVQANELQADGNEVAIETLEIAHEGLSLEPVE